MTVTKTGSRRIEFKTRTDEQKMLFEQKKDELGFKTLSAMARHALEQLIEGSDMASPEVFRLQRELQEKDERIMELEATLTDLCNPLYTHPLNFWFTDMHDIGNLLNAHRYSHQAVLHTRYMA